MINREAFRKQRRYGKIIIYESEQKALLLIEVLK